MSYVLLRAAAFLIGGIPFAFLVVRARFGTDLRKHGSGNPGATNAARMWKTRRARLLAFFGILLLDAGKGYIACGVLPGLFTGLAAWAPSAAALSVVAGHTWSPVLGFRGGKGVATTLGAFLALELWATLIAVAVFLGIFSALRVVAAGSIGMAVALPIAVFVRARAPLSVGYLAVALGILIIVRHRGNIQRMRRGEEK